MAVILTCIFTACNKNDAQKPTDNGGTTPYIRFVVDDVEYSKVQTKGNEIIVMPANPTKDGYTFVGWFWDTGTWDRPFTANSMLDEPLKNDMTVYAYFEKMHEHTYSKDWTYDATNHWHASTCGHSVVDGKAPHTFNDVNICTICGYKDVALHGTDIKTNTLTLENNNISGKVSNNQEVFSFIDEITVADGATFSVSTDINGSNVIRTKTVNLAIGDNTYYILVESGKDIKLYNVFIRRRPIYTVAFNENGGTEVQTQQVEEDGFATEPTSERVGYTFDKWNWNFGNAITDNTTVTASWNAIPYNITYDLNGGENPVDNPATYTIEDEIVLSAPVKVGYTGTWSNGGQIAKGSTGNKHFVATYTINQYNVSVLQSINNSCDHTRGGVYDYASQITLSANPYLGYDFVGWYDGDTLLTEENTFVFVVPARDCNITAKTTAKAEMQNFEFSSTKNSCTINKIKDKSATKVVIPDYVSSIGDSAFYECTGLTSINYTGDIAGWCVISGLGNLMSSSKTLYIGGNKVEGELVIPDGVTSISSSAFNGCTGLTGIVIPNSVTSIGEGAFKGCSSLASITIPFVGGRENGGSYGYNKVFGYIFGYTTTSSTSSNISGAICQYYTNAGTRMDCYWYYIPSSLKSVKISDGETYIPEYAFKGCKDLTSVTIPNSVTSIRYSAFEDCSSLESITIPDGVKAIASWAFKGCTSMTNITIPNGSIASGVFYGCRELTSITIPDNVTSIGDYAFYGCSGLTSIVIPDSVTSIGDYASYGCSGLTSIVIPDNVTSIGDYAFFISGLTNVIIGDGVLNIGDYVFCNCMSINFKGTKAQWKAINKGTKWNFDMTNICKIVCTDGTI